jgi:hypothetical protein
MQSVSVNRAAPIALAALAIQGLVLTPPVNDGGVLYPIIVLLGPLATGAIAAARGRSWRPVAATWALAAAVMFADDFLLATGNQGFHVALGILMVALTAFGAFIGRSAGRQGRRADLVSREQKVGDRHAVELAP